MWRRKNVHVHLEIMKIWRPWNSVVNVLPNEMPRDLNINPDLKQNTSRIIREKFSEQY